MKSSKILIIDDSEFSREIVAQILRSHGMENILLANDGQQGLDILKREKPDLVITDLIMPVMDGYEFCRQVRSSKEFADLVIIVMTAIEEPEKRALCFRDGASDLLVKPINSEELIARVNAHLERQIMLIKMRSYNNRVEEELEAARQMQLHIIPSANHIANIEKQFSLNIGHYFAASTELSGDLWGILPLEANKFSVYMVDFTGHGLIASMNTFRMHSLMRGLEKKHKTPGKYLSHLNNELCHILQTGQFATMFYGIFDLENNSIDYASAASPSPIIFSDQKMIFLDGSGLPLGVCLNEDYPTRTVNFNPQDIFFAYSDALIEKTDGNKNIYNEQRLLEFCENYLDQLPQPNLQKFCADILKHYFNEEEGENLEDDLTMFMLRCHG